MKLYLPRLQRDGWIMDEKTYSDGWLLSRDIREKWQLKKRVTASLKNKGPYGEVYWETHWLCGPDGDVPLQDEWAEVDGRSVIYAAQGKLFRLAVHRKGPDIPVRVADLSPKKFKGVKAPTKD